MCRAFHHSSFLFLFRLTASLCRDVPEPHRLLKGGGCGQRSRLVWAKARQAKSARSDRGPGSAGKVQGSSWLEIVDLGHCVYMDGERAVSVIPSGSGVC